MSSLRVCLIETGIPKHQIVVGYDNLPQEIRGSFDLDNQEKFAIMIKFTPPLDFSTLRGPRKLEALATVMGDAAGHIWFWKSEHGWFEDCDQTPDDNRWLKLLWGLAGDAFKEFGVYNTHTVGLNTNLKLR